MMEFIIDYGIWYIVPGLWLVMCVGLAGALLLVVDVVRPRRGRRTGINPGRR